MKKVTITPKQQEIDWSKPQWVQSGDRIVLTTGTHIKDDFVGTCLPCEFYPNGSYSEKWGKKFFRLLTEEIQFTISNQD